MDSVQWTVCNGQWVMDIVLWTVGNGRWAMDSGKWTVFSVDEIQINNQPLR